MPKLGSVKKCQHYVLTHNKTVFRGRPYMTSHNYEIFLTPPTPSVTSILLSQSDWPPPTPKIVTLFIDNPLDMKTF